jgi:hypothetical protein
MSSPGARRLPCPEPEEPLPIGAPLIHLFAHDLRAPLTTLSAYAELLRSPGLAAGQRVQFVEAIGAQAHRIARMIADLEALALPVGVPSGIDAEGTDAVQCMRGAIADACASPTTRPVQVRFEPERAALPVLARPDQLQRALAWLLEVAVRRGAADAPVIAWARHEGSETSVGIDVCMPELRDADVTELVGFEPGPRPPDAVRGLAGPLWASLRGLERAGARQQISRIAGGLRWALVLPTSG